MVPHRPLGVGMIESKEDWTLSFVGAQSYNADFSWHGGTHKVLLRWVFSLYGSLSF